MPISIFGMFFLSVLAVIFWTWPVWVVVCIVGARIGRLRRALILIALLIPLLAVVFQVAFMTDGFGIPARRWERLQQRHFGDISRPTLLKGKYFGHILQDDRSFLIFQFPAGRRQDASCTIEIRVPTSGNNAVSIREGVERLADGGEAVMFVSSVYSQPLSNYANPREFFAEFYPDFQSHMLSNSAIVLDLESRDGSRIYTPADPDFPLSKRWRSYRVRFKKKM